MKFVFLYGAPSVGKLTVARELSRLTGLRVFDNHLVVDTVLALYDFGTPSFIALRETLWRAAFERIVSEPPEPGLIFTFNPENTVPQKFIDDLFELLAKAGIDVRCVELTAPEKVIEERLVVPDRRDKRKLVDLDLYRQLRDAGVFATPVIQRNRLVIDTSKQPPQATAQQIATSLNE
jgi:hypothetical protein